MVKIKSVTLTPGKWIYVCPCGFSYIVSRVFKTTKKNACYCFACKQQNGKYFKVMDERLDFNYNFNGKLNGHCFGIIRLHNPIKWAAGSIKHIYYKDHFKGDAMVMYSTRVSFDKINIATAKLLYDMYPIACCEFIKSLYKKTRPGLDWTNQDIDIVTLEYFTQKEPSLFESF